MLLLPARARVPTRLSREMSNASAAGGAGVGAGAGAGSGAGAEAGARKRPRPLAADGSSSSDEAGAQLSAQMQRMSAELAHTQRLLAAYMSRGA